MFKKPIRGLLALCLLLAACAPLSSAPSPGTEPAATPVAAEQTTPQGTPSNHSGATALTVWLPPRFDPNAGTLAANMLQDRLDEFSSQNQQIRLEVRVKAQEGQGRLLDALLAAKAAAPLAQPDVVLLPHNQLSEAVSNQALLPLMSLTSSLDAGDWYAFASQMGQVDGQTYALPFAADALIMVYRPAAIEQIPRTWDDLLSAQYTLGFSAAEPRASFAWHQILSLPDVDPTDGQEIQSEDLQAVVDFFADGSERGLFPFWLTQYETSEQSWGAFSEGRVPALATWSSLAFDSRNVDIHASPLPTADGRDFAVLRGWVWAISTAQTEHLDPATKLIDFLTQPEFMAQWSAAAGLLPPRQSSLAAWSPDARQVLASQIVHNAAALPQLRTADSLGSALSQTTIGLLKQEITREEAMDLLEEALSEP